MAGKKVRGQAWEGKEGTTIKARTKRHTENCKNKVW